jgi:hypothetical protein
MSYSFGIVEEKVAEAAFFLDRLGSASSHSFEARCYFSAFASAARSVTLSLQYSMEDVPGFLDWYVTAQEHLKADALASQFKEIRNDIVHKGLNPLNQVSLAHLREYLSAQLRGFSPKHVLVLPCAQSGGARSLLDIEHVAREYFTSLLAVVYECYDRFKAIVDPQWFFTEEHFVSMGRSFQDAVMELGFLGEWADAAPRGADRWRVLRSQQPECQLNPLFRRFLGRTIAPPDAAS